MRTIQFREAVCEAMSEEMRRDPSIYLMGEEVAEYNGAYKASKGMLDEFGPKRIIDTPIAESGFSGIGFLLYSVVLLLLLDNWELLTHRLLRIGLLTAQVLRW